MAQKIKFGWLRDFNGNRFVPKILANFIFNEDGTKYTDTVDGRFSATDKVINEKIQICIWEDGDDGSV